MVAHKWTSYIFSFNFYTSPTRLPPVTLGYPRFPPVPPDGARPGCLVEERFPVQVDVAAGEAAPPSAHLKHGDYRQVRLKYIRKY